MGERDVRLRARGPHQARARRREKRSRRNLTTDGCGAGKKHEEERSVFSVLASGRTLRVAESEPRRPVARVRVLGSPEHALDDTELWLVALDPATGMPLRSWCLWVVAETAAAQAAYRCATCLGRRWVSFYFASDHLDRAAFPRASDLSTTTTTPAAALLQRADCDRLFAVRREGIPRRRRALILSAPTLESRDKHDLNKRQRGGGLDRDLSGEIYQRVSR